MVTRVCVLRNSREYNPKHVQWLAKQVPGLVCLSDAPVEGVPTIPLRHNWPGWWAKMELFRPDINGDLLYFDIDTVVIGDVSALEVGKSAMLSDFYRPELPASGLMYIAQDDKDAVWREFTRDPAYHMRRCQTRDRWGDQGFLKDVFDYNRWDAIAPGKIVSYKVHCKHGVPDGACVVCFHGKPRPWDSGTDWVPVL